MFCTKCGKELPNGSNFCTGCGAALGQAPAPASAPAPDPAPTPTPVYASAPMPAAPVAGKKKIGGGVIALIVAAAVLAVAVIALVTFLLLSGKDAAPEASDQPVGAVGAPDVLPAGSFDASDMDGTYFCAQETGSTLELRVKGSELSIYKTYYSNPDVSTLIPLPTSNRFTIDYGGRIIEFFYSPSGGSVTVSESGESSLFTTDGDRSWVIDAAPQVTDPFTDPDGYILPTDSQYITEADLYPFNEEQVKLIRNEIYARHGYSFTMEKFQDYFRAKNWYWEDPNVNVNTFGTQHMNPYERANVDTIKTYEERMGW